MSSYSALSQRRQSTIRTPDSPRIWFVEFFCFKLQKVKSQFTEFTAHSVLFMTMIVENQCDSSWNIVRHRTGNISWRNISLYAEGGWYQKRFSLTLRIYYHGVRASSMKNSDHTCLARDGQYHEKSVCAVLWLILLLKKPICKRRTSLCLCLMYIHNEGVIPFIIIWCSVDRIYTRTWSRSERYFNDALCSGRVAWYSSGVKYIKQLFPLYRVGMILCENPDHISGEGGGWPVWKEWSCATFWSTGKSGLQLKSARLELWK